CGEGLSGHRSVAVRVVFGSRSGCPQRRAVSGAVSGRTTLSVDAAPQTVASDGRPSVREGLDVLVTAADDDRPPGGVDDVAEAARLDDGQAFRESQGCVEQRRDAGMRAAAVSPCSVTDEGFRKTVPFRGTSRDGEAYDFGHSGQGGS